MTQQLPLHEVKQRVTQQFDRMAPIYDRMAPMRSAAGLLLQAAALQPGMQVLDIACGTGHLALAAAELVEPDGSVAGIDISPNMVQQAGEKSHAAGLTNVEFRLGDAEALDVAGGSVDAVLCGLGIHFLPNQRQALTEWRRALKSGGWARFSVWGERLFEPGMGMLGARLAAYGLGSPRPFEPALLPLAEQSHDLLVETGFANVAVVTEQVGSFYATVDDYWQEASGGPVAAQLSQLSPERRAQFEAEHRAEIAQTATDQGIWRNAEVHIASGQKP